MNINYIKEEIYENDGTNFYVNLTKGEIEDLHKIQEKYNKLFQKQKNAVSTLIKLIIENTYLYINNKEADIDNDINEILTKKYYRNLNPLFIDLIHNDTKIRDYLIELIRVRTLKQYIDFPLEDSEEKQEIQKVQFRLSNNDTNTMSILMGSTALTTPDYIASLIRYFLHANKEEILNYKSILKIEYAIKNSEYLIINEKKYKPIRIQRIGNALPLKCLIAFDESSKEFAIKRLNRIYLDTITLTMQKYSLNSLEQEILDNFNHILLMTVSYDKTEKDSSSIKILSIKENEGVKKTIKGNHETVIISYNPVLIKELRKYEKEGYITNLVLPNEYLTFNEEVLEYKKL